MANTRLSVLINDETRAALADLAARRDTTITDIVRRSVMVYKFLEDKTAEGKAMQLVDDDETITLALV